VLRYDVALFVSHMDFSRKPVFVPVTLLLALGVLAVAALVPLPDQLTASPVVRRGFDASHLPLFALAAGAVLWFVVSLRSGKVCSPDEDWRRAGQPAILVAAFFVGIAALVELVQPSTGRSASFADFFHGALGAVLGAWWMGRRRIWKLRERWTMWSIALMASLTVGWPVVMAGQHSRQLEASFPQLIVGKSFVDAEFWHADGGAGIEFPAADSSDGSEYGIRVETQSKSWSGLSFRPTQAVADWSDRSELIFEISCADDVALPFTLGLKIEDTGSRDHATRFNHSFQLDEGRQVIRIVLADIPAAVVDLSRVTRLALFVSGDDPAHSFVVDRAFLK